MKTLPILSLLLVQSFAFGADAPRGEEVKNPSIRKVILGAMFTKLKNAPYNRTNLAEGLGAFLGENIDSRLRLTCAEKSKGHGADVLLSCSFVVGYGSSPAMQIDFEGIMSADGEKVLVYSSSITHEISP